MISTFKKLVRRTLGIKDAPPQLQPALEAEAASEEAVANHTVAPSDNDGGRAAVAGAAEAANVPNKGEPAPSAGTEQTAADEHAGAIENTEGNGSAEASNTEEPALPTQRRLPARRAPKLDQPLAEAVAAAREGILEIAEPGQIGEHAGVRAEDDRVVTHRFEASLPGYGGWQWFAVVTRVPRSKKVTVSEVGLLPSERSLLAPQWVPWAERVRPGEEEEHAEREQSRQNSGR